MTHIITSTAALETIKASEQSFVLLVTNDVCVVGERIVLKTKKLVAEHFPKLKTYTTCATSTPEVAAQLSVFVVPTVLVFFDGKKQIQKSRVFSITELESDIRRYYTMVF